METHNFICLWGNINQLNQLFNFVYKNIENFKELFENKDILKLQQKLYKYLVKIFIESPPKCFKSVKNFTEIKKDYSAKELVSDVFYLLNNNAPSNWPHFCYKFSLNQRSMECFFKESLQKMIHNVEPMYLREMQLNEHAINKLCKQSTDLLQYIETNEFKLPNDKNFFQSEANMFARETQYENIF